MVASDQETDDGGQSSNKRRPRGKTSNHKNDGLSAAKVGSGGDDQLNAANEVEAQDPSQAPSLISYEAGETIDEEDEDSESESAGVHPNGKTQRNSASKQGGGEFGRKKDIPWESGGFDADEEWGVQDHGKDSPSTWDPDSFTKQTGDLGSWKGKKQNQRLQDLPSPAVAEPPPDQRTSNSDDEEWPFKSPCAFHGRAGRKGTPKSGQSASSGYGSSDIDSVGGGGAAAEDRGSKSRKSRDSGGLSMPKRSSGRPDAEEGNADAPPTRPKTHDADKPLKPLRRTKSIDRDQEENEEDDELQGSFHNLAEDMDKPRSRSKDKRRPKGRRRMKEDASADRSSGGDDDDEDYEEFGGDETEQKLKGEDDAASSGGGKRKSWRQRRADNRANRERSMSSDSGHGSRGSDGRGTIDAPHSGGRRPPSSRRAMIRRAQSERWRKNVDNEETNDSDAVSRRAKNSELSRSAHSVRRYHSGGLHRMTGGLDRQAYQGRERQQTATEQRLERRARRKADDQLGTASYHGVNEYDLSGRSQRTLDSIEDLEDFEHIDFQTPGMIDIDDEIYELMQRANPEDTIQLNRRVHRQREKMTYDQNMPMMTRQALLTRQQAIRGRVDANNIDRRRLLLRNDSNASMGSTDELSFSQHRARYSTTPGRRAPPRSRSSGLAAMAAQTMQQPPRPDDGDDRRKLFRTRSTSTNSFRQYLNKPNKVAQLSRRAPGSGGNEPIDAHSMRGTSSGAPPEKRKPIQRAKSTTALRRPQRTDVRRSPRRVETANSLRPVEARVGKDEPMPSLKQTTSDDSESDSSLESMGGDDAKSPKKNRRKVTRGLTAPTRKPSQTKSPKPKRRDLSRRSHRRKLHALLYETKMGITMKDLIKKAQKPDDKNKPAALMITAP